LKSFGDKAAGLFERKKKETGEIASEKVSKAQKLAEEQLKKTQDAVTGATSGASGLIAGISSDAKDATKKAGK
jgi:hypothetical protein